MVQTKGLCAHAALGMEMYRPSRLTPCARMNACLPAGTARSHGTPLKLTDLFQPGLSGWR
ncbi:MAG: hypothetical protein H7289_02625 [Mucilaginibacter sp.]|nr:hypothetical protein [Mucilaginibacter sp.]